MPLLRINATDQGLQLHDSGSKALPQIEQTAQQPPGPAIIMIHGYKYNPGHLEHCPHAKLFSSDAPGWPGALGCDARHGDRGLGIAFGWSARGSLKRVHQRAADYGLALATLVQGLKDAAPHRPVHVIAHSLGSEIALAALATLPPRAIDRMILLTGASFSGFAQEMLATQAGQSTEVFNIASRENDVFDLAFETLVGSPRVADRAIGQGLDGRNVINIQLDCETTLSALAGFGTRIEAPQRQICHWSSYTRPGVMAFYARLLHQPSALPFADLRARLPDQMAPRWSRLSLRPLASQMRQTTSWTTRGLVRTLGRKASVLAGTTPDPKAKEPAF